MPSLSCFALYMMALVGQLGYLGVYLVIGLEYACFPIPSEIILPFVGMSITQTNLQFFPVILVSLLAGLSGSLFCYAVGYYGGLPLLNALSKKNHSVALALTKFNKWFTNYGHWAVLFTRIIPLTRTYISLFAGVSHMSLPIFLLYSSTGIILWNFILISLGLYLGNNWSLIEGILNTYSNVIITLLGICFFLFFLRKVCFSQKHS